MEKAVLRSDEEGEIRPGWPAPHTSWIPQDPEQPTAGCEYGFGEDPRGSGLEAGDHTGRLYGVQGRGPRGPAAGLRDYTFVTLVKPLLDRAVLMALTGYVDEAMLERYDVPYLLERAKQLQPVRAQLEAM